MSRICVLVVIDATRNDSDMERTSRNMRLAGTYNLALVHSNAWHEGKAVPPNVVKVMLYVQRSTDCFVKYGNLLALLNECLHFSHDLFM